MREGVKTQIIMIITKTKFEIKYGHRCAPDIPTCLRNERKSKDNKKNRKRRKLYR